MRRSRATFWAAQSLGGAVIAFGVAGLLRNAEDTEPGSWLRFLLGALLAHDLVLYPLVALAGVAVARAVPAWARPTVQGALLVSAIVVLFSVPVLGGYGRLANNPSLLPNDYERNLALVLGAIWLVAAALLIGVRARSRSPRRRC